MSVARAFLSASFATPRGTRVVTGSLTRRSTATNSGSRSGPCERAATSSTGASASVWKN